MKRYQSTRIERCFFPFFSRTPAPPIVIQLRSRSARRRRRRVASGDAGREMRFGGCSRSQTPERRPLSSLLLTLTLASPRSAGRRPIDPAPLLKTAPFFLAAAAQKMPPPDKRPTRRSTPIFQSRHRDFLSLFISKKRKKNLARIKSARFKGRPQRDRIDWLLWSTCVFTRHLALDLTF